MNSFRAHALAAAMVAIALAGAAEEPTVKAKSTVAAVTVMPDRAVVTRRFTVDLKTGRSLVIVDGLLPVLKERTLKCLPATGARGVKVVDLASEVYESTAPVHEELAGLEAERKKLAREVRAFEDEIVSLKERGRMLGQYRTFAERAMKLGLVSKEPPLEQWRGAVDYVLSEGLKITRRVREIEKRRFALKELARELDVKMRELKAPQKTRARRARIVVDCTRPGTKLFELSYLVNAGITWGPRYDVRLSKAE